MARFISTLGYAPPAHISVLILTDEVGAGKELSALLHTQGLVTRSAPAKRLDRMLAAETPDAFVIDWATAGADALHAARRAAPHIPVIAVVATDSFAARRPLLEMGVEHLVCRPLDPEEIAIRVRVASENAARQHAYSTKVDAMRMWGDWVRYLVHDLRNPVTVAMAAVSQALDTPDEAPAALADADRALADIAQMLRDILDTDRIKHGALAPVRKELDLAQLAQDAAQDIAGARIDVQSEGDTWVAGDPALLRRVIGNLVMNASRHVRHKPVEVRVVGTAHGVSARVANDGPGIDASVRPHLFEPWQRVSGLHAGTGIGLAFCRLVCEAHGGSIWLDSANDGDVAFAFGLPRAVALGAR